MLRGDNGGCGGRHLTQALGAKTYPILQTTVMSPLTKFSAVVFATSIVVLATCGITYFGFTASPTLLAIAGHRSSYLAISSISFLASLIALRRSMRGRGA